jgi:cytochrome c oxidase subunit 2
VRYIEGVNNLGVDLSDPNAQDDFASTELHLPKGKRVIFKMRSQDVLHSAYMPHFRAQMNCVPGMVTTFSFIPTLTTTEMRERPAIVEKVANINAIRAKNSEKLVAKGEPALEPYTFDYLLLCNKICGASHYNMQMKIVVDTPEDFNKWMKEKQSKTIAAAAKVAAAEAQATEAEAKKPDTTAVTTTKDTTLVANSIEVK